eukprot:6213298-Pleurochrysis_carterae.AAC.3
MTVTGVTTDGARGGLCGGVCTAAAGVGMYRWVVNSFVALASSVSTSTSMAHAEPVAGAKADGRVAATL